MRKIRLYWYFVYYSLHSFWFKISGGYKFAFFQADVSLSVLSVWLYWFFINVFNKIFNYNFYEINFIEHFPIIILIFFLYWIWNINEEVISLKYFTYFKKLSKKRKIICQIIVWMIILGIIIGFWSTIEWMRME